MSEKVLLVDDDKQLLRIYSQALADRYELTAVTSGEAALAAIATDGPFSVVVSDMQMPGMDGVQLLEQLKTIAPGTVRVMLTGMTNLKIAEAAVNKGEIFRFIQKPPVKQQLLEILQASINQHKLMIAENELLENTFKAVIEALANVLSLSNPQIFGRTMRIKGLVQACAAVMNIDDRWELESTAMLSQLGCVTLPDELISKVFSQAVLTEQEKAAYQQYPRASADLISKIPKMAGVTENIVYQLKGYDGSGYPEDAVKAEQIPLGARMLKVLLDFDHYESSGLTDNAALSELEHHNRLYDPGILSALAKVVELRSGMETKQIEVSQLTPAMIFAQDVYAKSGSLLVCNGQPVTQTLADRLVNFRHNGGIGKYIRVHVASS